MLARWRNRLPQGQPSGERWRVGGIEEEATVVASAPAVPAEAEAAPAEAEAADAAAATAADAALERVDLFFFSKGEPRVGVVLKGSCGNAVAVAVEVEVGVLVCVCGLVVLVLLEVSIERDEGRPRFFRLESMVWKASQRGAQC